MRSAPCFAARRNSNENKQRLPLNPINYQLLTINQSHYGAHQHIAGYMLIFAARTGTKAFAEEMQTVGDKWMAC